MLHLILISKELWLETNKLIINYFTTFYLQTIFKFLKGMLSENENWVNSISEQTSNGTISIVSNNSVHQ